MNEDKIRRTVKSAALIPMMMRFALIHVMITQKKEKETRSNCQAKLNSSIGNSVIVTYEFDSSYSNRSSLVSFDRFNHKTRSKTDKANQTDSIQFNSIQFKNSIQSNRIDVCVVYNCPEFLILTGLDTFPDSDPTASILSNMSIPSITVPNTTCLPSNQVVFAVHKKN